MFNNVWNYLSAAHKVYSLGGAGAVGVGILTNPASYTLVATELTALGTITTAASAITMATVGAYALAVTATIAFCTIAPAMFAEACLASRKSSDESLESEAPPVSDNLIKLADYNGASFDIDHNSDHIEMSGIESPASEAAYI